MAVRRVLGELERRVLDRLWRSGAGDVKTVHAATGAPRGISPKTVQSALERLRRKGLVERRREGRAYVYAARVSREDLVADLLREAVEGVPGTDAEVWLAAFVDLTARVGESRLRELERLVALRRRRDGRGPG